MIELSVLPTADFRTLSRSRKLTFLLRNEENPQPMNESQHPSSSYQLKDDRYGMQCFSWPTHELYRLIMILRLDSEDHQLVLN